MAISSNKKAEPAKPYVDEKKEKMKTALFSGISARRDSDDSDDEAKAKPQEVSQEPAGEVNLLDFDSGPTEAQNPPTTTNDLLDSGMGSSNAPATSNNLLDVMDAGMPQAQPAAQANLQQSFDNILSGFGQGPAAVQQQPQVPVKFTGVAGFTTADFGQTWMQMQNPAAEQKFTTACPMFVQ